MSRGRFGLLLALLVLVVGAASFLGVLALLDEESGQTDQAESSTTTSSSTTTTVPAGLSTPTFVAVVSSEPDEAAARAMADELTERGYDSRVLQSDLYGSLEPGFYVAYVGPFADVAAAQVATAQLVADGYEAAYARCVGTADECG